MLVGEVGTGKPRRAVFDLVRASLRAEGPLLMVGDSWERDVVGALDAGWSAVWVSHGRPLAGPVRTPVVEGVLGLRHRLLPRSD